MDKRLQGFFGFVLLVVLATGFFPGLSEAGQPGRKNPEIRVLIEMARAGDPEAMTALGLAYYQGRGVLKDPLRARCWIQRAYDLGARDAQDIWNSLALWQVPGPCPRDIDPIYPLPGPGLGPEPGTLALEPLTGMRFVFVPGGCFVPADFEAFRKRPGRMPGKSRAQVCVEGFWMGQYEVTQDQWQRIMDHNPSRFQGRNLPVEQVTFEEAMQFARLLSRATGQKFSLPTPAQWEFACQAGGSGQPFPWGEETFRPLANCGGCDTGGADGRTTPGGSYPPNDLGIFDLGGNVREWCRDEGRSPDLDRPVKGGSLVDLADRARCGALERLVPGTRAYYLGFRLITQAGPGVLGQPW